MRKGTPPRSAAWLIARSLPPADRDAVLGDFAEFFSEFAAAQGSRRALAWYWRQALRSLPRLLFHSLSWSMTIIRNYLLITLRRMGRRKIHSLINIGGLAMGTACCILIFLFVRHELSYDRFHAGADRIFLLHGTLVFGNAAMVTAADPPLAPTLPGLFPEVAEAVRVSRQRLICRREGTHSHESGIAADPVFFDVFTFPLLRGNRDGILEDPQSVVLSRRMAWKYFGGRDPVGQTLEVRLGDEFEDFRVAAVCADPPGHSSLKFDFILNLRKAHGKLLDSWDSGRHLPTFLLLDSRGSGAALQEKFPDTIDARLRESFGEKSRYHLQALRKYHLGGGRASPVLEDKSRAAYSWILSGIALLVLLIACFNYTNLAVAGASTRLNEIGMRKVLGADRRRLRLQFWFESLVTSLFALAAGVIAAGVFLPSFNKLTGKGLTLLSGPDGSLWVALAGLILFVGFAAGGYPALVLSGYHPVALFRGRCPHTGRRFFSRGLIVFQFAISIFLIISALFLSRQYRYLMKKNLSFESGPVLMVSLEEVSTELQHRRSIFPVLKRRLESSPGIRSVSGSEFGIARFWASKAPEIEEGRRELLDFTGVDYDYVQTLGIPLVQGRNFSPDFPTDLKEAVIVNRMFVERFEMDSPLGKRLSEPFLQDFPGTIVGVMENFHYQSLRQPIRPAYIHLQPKQEFQYLYVRLTGDDLRGAVSRIGRTFEELVPEVPFHYSFLDEEVARQYRNEARWEKLAHAATLFAILIACSGLFGLTMMTAWRRTKEIGIRKVLGASTGRIAWLINREFIGMVAGANLLAWPATYFAVRALLQNYAYRVPLSVWSFLLGSVLGGTIALFTVSAYALRVGAADPVGALRRE